MGNFASNASKLKDPSKLNRVIYSSPKYYQDLAVSRGIAIPNKLRAVKCENTPELTSSPAFLALPSKQTENKDQHNQEAQNHKIELKTRLKRLGCTTTNGALLEATYRLDAESVRLLLEKGADPNYCGPFEKVSLDSRDIAIGNQPSGTAFSSALTILATKGILGSNCPADTGSNKYQLSLEGEHAAITSIGTTLLDFGADLRIPLEFHGSTALHVAAFSDNAILIEILTDFLYRIGVEELHSHINIKNSWGDSPLSIAARNGYTKVCSQLIGCGASVAWTHTKMSRIAKNKGFVETANVLEREEKKNSE